MAAALQQQLGITPTMIQGRGGIFDVKADGKMIYSKFAEGRFPEHGEVIEALKPLLKT
ncbi:MAG: hypothetical protein HUU29_00705 [Planctomycetaceae bacterium]|nr:hypothetical protein [Planctomycetaceae bacterium]